jgi:predicted glutamine amidotransferase
MDAGSGIMCRLFGSLCSNVPDLEWHLVSSGTSLLAQSTAFPKRIQGDGWGIGHYDESGRPRTVLSTGAIFEERQKFYAAVGKASGPLVIAHIREASNPMNLPREKLLRIENQQPFIYKNWVFAHNGTLKLPKEVSERLGKHRRDMRGNNDSEVFFWLMMSGIERTGSVRKAFDGALKTILEVWEESPAAVKRKVKLPYVSLNTIFSDGERLYAICKYDGYRPKHGDNWLCGIDPPRPLLQMCYLTEDDGSGLVVASERTEPSGEWVPLEDGNLLEARLVQGRVRVKVEDLG